jgi:hypothetical protein
MRSVPDVVTIECLLCHRPVAEITDAEGHTRPAGAGSVHDEHGPDGKLRYHVACERARKHKRQARTWTAATLGRCYRAYAGRRPRISMGDVRRDVPLPAAPRSPAPNPAQGGGSSWRPGVPL